MSQAGQQQTLSRTLACSLHRGPASSGGGVELIVYPLLIDNRGEQSCLAVGGSATAGSSR